ncbi:PepSY-like domain-containing protein [Parapedobacter koreensis]|uniref:Putative beta-lactamase-inhibitor-like, PepSY-like n=1 Tax=Parapedobacter koreensis TaxID=332977 RepID=A0A1H7J640_9SPHI|nr:PepSY-like domain-containing protein [Parapedobacter koreensis]SEK69854.1 Putative beta-lactamase-inhibitor-like, PepSY-like [Parapedobacter koreensis]
MKKLVFNLFVLFLTGLSVMAQGASPRGVPAVVINAFQQQFSKARQVEWERRKDGSYEVEFNVGLIGRDQKAFISPEGKVLKHEEEIASSALPEAVKKQLKTEFDGYRVEDAKKIDTAGTVAYEVELESRYGDLQVRFDSDGKILKERMD